MGRRMCGTTEGAAVWCNLDPCGLICAGITYGLVAYSQYAVTVCVVGQWLGYGSFFGVLHVVVFNALACLAHASHARAMLTDPGAVSSRALPPAAEVEAAGGGNGRDFSLDTRRLCRKCNAYKPVRAHHCSICGRCVVKMDHHCPWVNNCVGIGNHKFFIQFISYVFTISVYALLLAVCRFCACLKHVGACRYSPSKDLAVVFLVIEAMLFGLFTMCMVCDQWEVVSTNQTQIDRLKGESHAQPSLEINELFGGSRSGRGFRLDFFLPTRVVFPADIWEEVMGYRCHDACGLAAAAVAKVSGGALGAAGGVGSGSDDDDLDRAGDVEMGEFYSAGGSGTIRERRQQQQQSADTQRLLTRSAAGNGGGVGVGNGDTISSRSLGSSPLHGRDGSSARLLPGGGKSSSNSGSGGSS